MKLSYLSTYPVLVALSLSLSSSLISAEPLTLTDIMHFKTLQQPVLADDGSMMAVEAQPDRGESDVIVKSIDGTKNFEITNGTQPEVTANGQFVIATIPASLLDKETKKKTELTQSLVLLNTKTGTQETFENVKSASFNDNGQYLAIWFKEGKPEQDSTSSEDDVKPTDINKKPKLDEGDKGSSLTLIHLTTQKTVQFTNVTQYAFDESGIHFVAAVNDHDNNQHHVTLISLRDQTKRNIYSATNEQVGELALSNNGRFVGFTAGKLASKRESREYKLHIIDIKSGKKRQPSSDGWTLNQHASVMFSRDNERLFVGRVPQVIASKTRVKYTDEQSLFNQAVITDNKNLRVWHGDDPKIKPHEVKEYQEELKRTYLAVYHIEADHMVQLADKAVPTINYGEQQRYLVATSDVPYKKMITWAGFYQDVYLVDVNTGRKILVLAQQPSDAIPTLSPNAQFLRYYQQGNVYIYDIAQAVSYNLSGQYHVPFSDEDHDYPNQAPGYGFGPWLADSSGFIAYDKYDAWQFNTKSHNGFMLSNGEGRKHGVEFRVKGLVEDKLPATLQQDQMVLLQGYSHRTKEDEFYQAKVGIAGVKKLTNSQSKLTFLARAKQSEQLLFSTQRFDLYPDIYTATQDTVGTAKALTQLDKQRQGFSWGHAELVQWIGADGESIDGVLIKPSNYQEGKTYPVMVYYYRFMSDRLHAFPDMKINHRPNFAWYTDNGYAIFLPDIRFEIGYPGISAVKALTSGVQKIVEMGVADPKKIGLHGHSWSGYQTAYAVTQTHIFAAAVSGAPVSNMTSAYSGIRHGSGLARQFQYEAGQSRMAESLYKAPQKYIENSPIFYVERIQTPMMIMFGDIDDAVPWEQGIEMYLAMRRAGKDVVFLQYEGEPHHLKKYPNKLDYTIKMREYFDHYLKGKPAPLWLEKGEAYQEYSAD